ncbi:MAG: efflux RND transporter periplasmic adaptor subunit [Betaproteobacteria bacterium]|nr:efflux RND transporter periplasmic adaptor subunit [Betaproteobacteria bacterium]
MAQPDLSKLRIERGAGAMRAKRRWPRLIGWLIVLAAIAAGVFYWRSTAPLPVETYSVATAYPSQAYTLLNATGYVVAQRKAAVASKATGRLEWLGVREGSSVHQGEVLARLENRDVTAKREQAAANVKLAQANLEQAQAELHEAERAFKRSSDLLERKFVSQAAHDTAIARLDKAKAGISAQRAAIAVAQANLRATEVEVEQTLIRAPFDGVVLTKNANVGDVITPFSSALGSQAAVVTMADMSTLEVEADVSESSVGKVRLDQPCEIQLDALPDGRFRGVVARMVPTVDRAKATVTVKVRFIDKDPRVLPEMSAKVAFLSQELPPELRTRRTVIDPGAIVERNGRRVVYVVREDRAIETPIEAGDKLGDWLEVVKGVAPGDKVVANPPEKLHDGDRIALQAASG